MNRRHQTAVCVKCMVPCKSVLTGLRDADEQALKLLNLEDEVGHLRIGIQKGNAT